MTSFYPVRTSRQKRHAGSAVFYSRDDNLYRAAYLYFNRIGRE